MRMGSRVVVAITPRGLGGVCIARSCARGRIGASGPLACIFYEVYAFYSVYFSDLAILLQLTFFGPRALVLLRQNM